MIVYGDFYVQSNKEELLIKIDAIEYEERPHECGSDNIVLYGEQLKMFRSLDHELLLNIPPTAMKSDYVSDLTIFEGQPAQDNVILIIRNASPSGSWKDVRINYTITNDVEQPYRVSLIDDYEEFFKGVSLNGDKLLAIAEKTRK